MTGLIDRFVASRAAKPAPQPIANAGDYVSRADFDKLVAVVNGMAKAVEGLIEDIDTAISPEKMQAVFNTALKDVMPAVNAARRGAPVRNFTAPKGDGDDLGDIMPPRRAATTAVRNAASLGFRPPLALEGE